MSKRTYTQIHSSSTKPTNAEISNFIPSDNAYTNAEERRKFKERRKFRKMVLDSRRSNVIRLSNYNNNNSTPSSKSQRYTICSNIITSTTSTLRKLSKGKHTLLSNAQSLSPLPMNDLTSDAQDPYKGVSKYYLDHGDQLVICEVCNAKLWACEAGKGRDFAGKTTYMLCCGYGKVHLPEFKETGLEYQNLFKNLDAKSKHFLQNIRRYNSMFSFTSMGGKVDSKINKGNAPFIYRISGENYHTLGSLLPKQGDQPKFAQLYIYDTNNEVSNRKNIFSNSKKVSSASFDSLDTEIIEYLKVMLDSNNQLVKTYRRVRDRFLDNPHVDLKLRLKSKRTKDGRTYNLPTSSEVAALIVGDIEDALDNRDVVVDSKKDGLQRISELHPSYIALQYPLLFPFGEDGYRIDILHREGRSSKKKKDSKCSMREYFAYRIQDRDNQFSLILNARRLLQQFLVDIYTMVESERLFYIRFQQKNLRSESYENLNNLRQNGNEDMSNVGKRVILPSSFTGGSRYMRENYYDAMAICKWFGYPDFFITITCNPKWPEIKRFLKDKNINPEDRPDILCRLFKIKLDSIIKDLREKSLFGKSSAVIYTIEFQKRGLPHAHICLFLQDDNKLPSVEHVDNFISAEIPDKNVDPELYTLVSDYMIHGPCGLANLNCPCMFEDSGLFVEKSDVQLDNRSVVPYNKTLLRRYQAHINVEWCNQAASIKYLFKYINKGPDRTEVAVIQNDEEGHRQNGKDEIKKHYDCRYLSACEASWRIFAFDIHYRYPSVIRLPFHLPDQQNVIYGPDDELENILNKPSISSTMFLSWMEVNKNNELARTLTYVEFPTKFVWNSQDRTWTTRKIGKPIGRIHCVNPSMGDAYFLRILLNKVRGPKSFEEIRTVNGQVFPTFRDACYALGLLDDDREYIEAIKEAYYTGSGYYLRNLFATMLSSNTLSRPEHVWENTWEYLADGILHTREKQTGIEGLSLPEEQIKNLTLLEIENYLLRNNSTLRRFPSMPYPDSQSIASADNRLITDELSYDVSVVGAEFNTHLITLTSEQRLIFDEITRAVDENKGGLFFVYGYGGTGKTFLWKTLSSAIRSKGQIVLNVASSGIASLLLSGGRTAHSRFHIPLNLTEESMCHIKPDGEVADLLKQTKLIIWDEAPMIHKHAFEALDRTMKDIFKSDDSLNSEMPFGGKVMVLGGDFRQILPVVPNGSRREIVNASITSSYIWRTCKAKNPTHENLYSPDVLNGLKISGLPNHRLVLKVGVPVMLLRNIDQQNGLCNGTRLRITKLAKRVIEAEIISGGNIGTKTYIPRITLIPSDKKIPVKFQRRQFPLCVCFAMTINKSQGQSLSRVGLYLKYPVFTHGQLYVALSRVKSRAGVKLLILDEHENVTNKTTNVVYKEIFSEI
ncbi:uncharacterized protein LOC110870312 [Helianthus annuus]|uniref:uncharacterized protein LOC110870312 n=1 Tax=Helianthus annuus TaxID=4232 RepID=UPI001652EAD9|nr:uncharacterized protein LOC110870312 [Helianthus annuus]